MCCGVVWHSLIGFSSVVHVTVIRCGGTLRSGTLGSSELPNCRSLKQLLTSSGVAVAHSQAQMQALAAAQAQAQLQRQMLAQQQALLGGGVAAVAAPAAMVAAAQMGSAAVAATAGNANDSQARKSREIYIGNLAIGTVTIEMLTELFNAALAGMVPDPVTNPPVNTVKMDNTGVW
jgi:splicing factor U2AF subunit